MRSGVLVVDKPRGPTSHDVVGRLRKVLRTREIGHAGTLDPMATGVLVIAVGEATKLAAYLTAHDKAYEATLALGVETDTLDALGNVVREEALDPDLRAALLASSGGSPSPLVARALDIERRRVEQIPPAFSAVHTGGKRAYERARAGQHVELAPRPVTVKRLDLVDAGETWLTLTLEVSKGYYVRALARDLAASLGTAGHLTALRRTRSGPFTLAEALPIDTPAEELQARLLPVEKAAARALPVARLTDAGARAARFGRPVSSGDVDAAVGASGPHAWLDPRGVLVAVGEPRPDRSWRVLRGFRPSA